MIIIAYQLYLLIGDKIKLTVEDYRRSESISRIEAISLSGQRAVLCHLLKNFFARMCVYVFLHLLNK